MTNGAQIGLGEGDGSRDQVRGTQVSGAQGRDRKSSGRAGEVLRRVQVDVVVTHYEDERRLGWVLNALAAQTYPAESLHVVVADDGSAALPRVPEGVMVVTQPNEGFRAAAARNLGARQGSSPCVLFLDGDTVPEPDWVEQMVWALVEGERADGDGATVAAPGALVVGRRCHADLTGFDDADVAEWVTNPAGRQQDRLIDDPQWLLAGYARTDDLRSAGPDDWRLVISAVMGVSRGLFDAVGGFDETLVGYGGEDWDLAYRAWNVGAMLRHVPDAVAWHDGPDAAARADFVDAKEGEQLALAARIPQPLVRGRHGVWPVPRVIVHWQLGELRPSVEYAVLESWLVLGDVGIWADEALISPLAGDPRVRGGRVPDDVAQRGEIVVTLRQPCLLGRAERLGAAGRLRAAERVLAAVVDGPIEDGRVSIGRTRHVRLGVEARAIPEGCVSDVPAPPVDLETYGREVWA